MKSEINSVGAREIRFDLWVNKNSKHPKRDWFNATERELKEIERLLNHPSITPKSVIHGLNFAKGLIHAKERKFKKWGRPSKVNRIVDEIKRRRKVTQELMKKEPEKKNLWEKLEKKDIEDSLKNVSYPTRLKILKKIKQS